MLLTTVNFTTLFQNNFSTAINNIFVDSSRINLSFISPMGTVVAQWLRCCATNRKVTGSIPGGVIGFFIDYGPGVNSASNRNEY